ncbi:MAG: 1-acyl-sn-glycerol-3-phosphate acyltransferase [Anaerolineales bacterium]|jgi:1-acyl-sn-glycerol-3-phosphate acyltransferase|nr:1-acyl-sn-glycerol-3-phosphate acyltransferase [Chloroflexota bacterium]MBK6646601.1 1-acyl-sn-glycerol-3-phosphate acyltransferase [Anaerolineales bacterium]MCC6986274.1 1-acyl-sn-glycerol-3-phosphate acyltransferase [Anaerolineales bacterium]
MKKFSLWFITNLLRVYFRLTLRLDAPDLKNVFPPRGPLIVITNHTGQVEVPVFATLLQPRRITGWGKAEAFENLFLRWVFWAWGIIPVHRGEADITALKSALRMLEDERIFGVAPEGTRNYTGILRRGLPGAAILALKSGAPIVPLVHWGGEVYMKNLKGFKRTDFHIRMGGLYQVKVEGRVTAEIRQQIADEMMCRIAELMPEYYRGEYSDLLKYEMKYLKPMEGAPKEAD